MATESQNDDIDNPDDVSDELSRRETQPRIGDANLLEAMGRVRQSYQEVKLVELQHYQYDLRNGTWHDWLAENHWLSWPLLAILVVFIKYLRLKLFYIPFEFLAKPMAACESDPDKWLDHVRDHMAAQKEQMLMLGFTDPVYYQAENPAGTKSIISLLVMRDTQSPTMVMVRYCQTSQKRHDIIFISRSQPDRWIVTRNRYYDACSWPAFDVKILKKMATERIHEAHRTRIESDKCEPIEDEASMRDYVMTYHDEVRESADKQGLLEIGETAKVAVADAIVQSGSMAGVTVEMRPLSGFQDGSGDVDVDDATYETDAANDDGEQDEWAASVLAEVRKIEEKKSSLGSGAAILIISLVAFFLIAWQGVSWTFMGALAVMLFIHELGHLLTMWLFKYQNLKMFFIPMFGAAVSGRHYNVPGWKKVIVALMGPLPSMVIGIAMGIAAMMHDFGDDGMLIKLALGMVALNTFNLLPILPLDGGWVMHALVFVRHPKLDATFRVITGVILCGCFLIDMKFLGLIGIFMLASAAAAYRIAKMALELKVEMKDEQADHSEVEEDRYEVLVDKLDVTGESVPDKEKAEVHQVPESVVMNLAPKLARQTGMTDKTAAQTVMSVFESANSRHMGVGSSVLLGMTYFGSLILGVFFVAIFLLADQGLLSGAFEAAFMRPQYPYHCTGKQRGVAPASKSIVIKEDESLEVTWEVTHFESESELASLQQAHDGRSFAFGKSLVMENKQFTKQLNHLELEKPGKDKEIDEELASVGVVIKREARDVQDAPDVSGLVYLDLQLIMPSKHQAEDLAKELMTFNELAVNELARPWEQVTPAQLILRQEMGAYYLKRAEASQEFVEAMRRGDFASLEGMKASVMRLSDPDVQQRIEDAIDARYAYLDMTYELDDLHAEQVFLDEKVGALDAEAFIAKEGDLDSDPVADESTKTNTSSDAVLSESDPVMELSNRKDIEKKIREVNIELGKLRPEYQAATETLSLLLGETNRVENPNPESAWGSIQLSGLAITMSLTVKQPMIELPRIANWLCTLGAHDLYYDINVE